MPVGPDKNEKKDKRLRAGRSRQEHQNRWQEDQIPPARLGMSAAWQPANQDLEGRNLTHPRPTVRASFPVLAWSASLPSSARASFWQAGMRVHALAWYVPLCVQQV